jgi:hypothetical protein
MSCVNVLTLSVTKLFRTPFPAIVRGGGIVLEELGSNKNMKKRRKNMKDHKEVRGKINGKFKIKSYR